AGRSVGRPSAMRSPGSRGKAFTPLPPLPEVPRARSDGEPILDRVLEELGTPRAEDALDPSAYEAPLPPRRISEDEPPQPPKRPERPLPRRSSPGAPAFVPPRMPGPHGPGPRMMAVAIAFLCGATAVLATVATRDRAEGVWAEVGSDLRELAPDVSP